VVVVVVVVVAAAAAAAAAAVVVVVVVVVVIVIVIVVVVVNYFICVCVLHVFVMSSTTGWLAHISICLLPIFAVFFGFPDEPLLANFCAFLSLLLEKNP